MPTTITTTQLLDTLNWRYATKKFDPARRIPADLWAALEASLVLTPSSFGLQPWKFLIVDDPAVRAKLLPQSWGQTQIVDAAKLVVLTVVKDLSIAHVDRFLASAAAARGATVESLATYRGMIVNSIEGARKSGGLDVWQTHQLYIALGQFMASAALLGVDTCPMEGLSKPGYDEVLGLASTGYTTVCACPAGYRAADDKYATAVKVRFPASDVIVHI